MPPGRLLGMNAICHRICTNNIYIYVCANLAAGAHVDAWHIYLCIHSLQQNHRQKLSDCMIVALALISVGVFVINYIMPCGLEWLEGTSHRRLTTDDDFSFLHFLTQFFYSAPEQLEIGFRTKKLHWGKHYFMYERWALSKAWTYFFFCTFLLFHLERIHAYAFNTENIVLNEVMWNEINMTSKGYFFLVVLIRKCWIYDAVRHNETSEALKQVVRFFFVLCPFIYNLFVF